MHAPLINPRIGTIGKKYNLKQKNFHLSTTLQGIANDVIFNGGGAFLKLLSDKKNKDKNFTIIASHIHNPKYILIDKHTRIAEEVTLDVLNAERNNPVYIKHLTTMALGVMSPESNNETRGYLEFSEDGFEEIIVT